MSRSALSAGVLGCLLAVVALGCREKAPPTAPLPPSSIPAVAGVLSPTHTVAFFAVEHVDVHAREQAVWLDALGDLETFRWHRFTQILDIDPNDPAAWRAAGIDPDAGLALAVDDRLGTRASPGGYVVLARVTDRQRFGAALKRGKPRTRLAAPLGSGLARIEGGPVEALVGERRGWTAFLLGSKGDLAQRRRAFQTWLADETPGFTEAEHGELLRRPPGAVVFAALFPSPARRQLAADPDLTALLDVLSGRITGLAGTMSADLSTGALRALVDPATVASLRKAFVPARPSPGLARFVRPDAIAFGLSLNLTDIFEGLGELVPPTLRELRAELVEFENSLPLLLGVSQVDLAAAFTGHVVVQLPLDELAKDEPEMAVLLGVADRVGADRVLAAATRQIAELAESALNATRIAGHPAHQIGAEEPIYVVRVDDAVIIGASRPLLEAIAAGDGAAVSAAAIDKGGLLSVVMPLSTLEVAMNDMSPAERRAVRALEPLLRRRVGEALGGALRLDDHGLTSDDPMIYLLTVLSAQALFEEVRAGAQPAP